VEIGWTRRPDRPPTVVGVLNRIRAQWQRTTVPLRALELFAAVVLFLALPRDLGPASVPFTVAFWTAALAWVAWTVADPLSLRRSTALTGARAVVVSVLLCVVAAASSFAAARSDVGWSFALAVIAAIAAARDVGVPGAVAVFLTGTAGVELGLLAGGGFSLAAVLGYPAGLLSAVLSGVVRAGRRDREEQARRLLTEQARGAALAERTRIAREVHDVLAHSLGGLAIQLEVADALLSGELDEPAREAARQRVRTAHQLATSGLEETRRAVHALRDDAPPLPASLAALAAGAGENGQVVALDVQGTPRPLGAGEVALLRTAQEALVNAAKHAAGSPVEVDLVYGAADTTLTVTDEGGRTAPALRTVDGGFGLAGLRERLELAGGSFSAGPHGAGWRVVARVNR
jgi:signal transduction histidine kinase